MDKKQLLELKNIYYSYDEETMVLDDISLTIYEGDRIAVLGNNGAGKSTLFLCCNGVITPNKGGRYLYDQLITDKKKSILSLHQAIGLVFQDPDDQIIASTVETELSFGPLNLGLTQEEARKRVNETIIAMNLEKYRKTPPHYLSGGEKKRVTIGDILVMEPKMILFDEPTASLDIKNTERFEEIIQSLSEQDMALLISTHDIDFAYRWAERILVLSEGKLLADDQAEIIFANEKLLQEANLKKPTIYRLTELFCKKYHLPLPKLMPKKLEEFADLFL